MEKEKIRFEAPEKPEFESLEILPNVEDFDEPEKAEAIIKNLSLSVGDTIKQNGEEFIINPKILLKGDKPEKYKQEVEEVKKILTENEIKGICLYYKRKKEDSKIRDKLYYAITKRVNKIYNWDDENKKHIPKKNSKRSLEICEALDWISDNNHMSGFDNLIYHLLDKDDRDFVYCYKCAWFNKEIPNIQEWREENDGEYIVLTDSEADYRAEEYLTDDTYLWQQSVEAGNTTESLDEWVKSVLNMDGRGSILNGYDGCEEYEKVNSTDYYIYRTN